MNDLAPILIAVLAIPLTIFFVRWKIGRTRKHIANYLAENRIEAEVIDGWMPPLRLWFKNRKGDSWCRVKMHDDQIRWVRVRNTLFSGTQIEFFE